MIRRAAATLIASVGLWALPAPAAAQAVCVPIQRLRAHLLANYGETVRAAGMSATGDLMVMFASPSGSWTLVHVLPRNPPVGCPTDSGEAFQLQPPPEKGDPS